MNADIDWICFLSHPPELHKQQRTNQIQKHSGSAPLESIELIRKEPQIFGQGSVKINNKYSLVVDEEQNYVQIQRHEKKKRKTKRNHSRTSSSE